MGEIILYVFLFMGGAVALYFFIDDDEAGLSSMTTFLLCLLSILMILTLTEFAPKEKPVSRYTVTKEVRKLDVNGTITEVDTVYVFTKKKN